MTLFDMLPLKQYTITTTHGFVGDVIFKNTYIAFDKNGKVRIMFEFDFGKEMVGYEENEIVSVTIPVDVSLGELG